MIISESGINWRFFYDLENMLTWREHVEQVTTKADIYVSQVWCTVEHANTGTLKIIDVHGIRFY